MLIKLLFIVLLLLMIIYLFRALPQMLKGQSSLPLSHYLGRRLLIAVILFGLLVIALVTGMIQPNPSPYKL
ncbi:DUF2909 family protein [Photobacterium phosphoreum]|uniref:DUF2909 family protein n=1 Tax=Photobacterium phosphoreum TaxID=659 RepID=UPI0005D2D5E2|nr:DUF2909 family protein [Photobacterium phosphoreum]KJF85225.1 hypothetical protein UB41_16260 [Photobacterium phosphoreum]PQJ92306.1 hypothetical protein BTO21_11710 [Photobacterium phosphoreum]PSU64212.1 DUF2909 domain-containing protein [Photobacterium phosphoreum]PSV70500.1 DUF2909 domain-containing protein [Photobacterium phosphoreum]PSW29415.1 DUF2909 domain-containing protein [Photobacterium phosphoreum]